MRTAGIIAALLVIAASFYLVELRSAAVPHFPQTIRYQVEGDRVTITIETPRWPGEALAEWQDRNTAAWTAWESKYGHALHDVDGR
jgi:hypothetical protein